MFGAVSSSIRQQRKKELKAEGERLSGVRYVDGRTMSRILTHAYKQEVHDHDRSKLYVFMKALGVFVIVASLLGISAKLVASDAGVSSAWFNEVLVWGGLFLLVGVGIFLLFLESNRFRKEEEGLFRSIKNQLKRKSSGTLEAQCETETRRLSDVQKGDNTSLAVSSLTDFEETADVHIDLKLDRIIEESNTQIFRANEN